VASRARIERLFDHAPALRAEFARSTVRERISDKLASLVASGILHVGDELPSERELASTFAVSRETVRGALQTLAAQGLVEIAQGARTRVVSDKVDTLKIGVTRPSAINSYDLESVHTARLLVERAVVAEAAARIDDATLAALARSLAIQKQTLRDPLHFLICDREFHLAIYRSAGNPLLADFVTDLYTFMLDSRRVAVSQPGAIEKSYRDHLAIYEALRERDPEATIAAFKRHIDRIYSTTSEILSHPPSERRTGQRPGAQTELTPDGPTQGRKTA
jgi:DNA-binding FadR family transcriptional regulator